MSSLPAVLEESWNASQHTLSSIHESLSSSHPERPRIIRVGQLDSELLDQELSQLLQEPILKALSLISVGTSSSATTLLALTRSRHLSERVLSPNCT